MAINQNHLFEELEGVKCAIVEKNVALERVEFLKRLLEFNQYTVVVVKSGPPKAAPPKPVPAAAVPAAPATPPIEEPAVPQPETFTVGVTDVSFNPINAIFGRLLRTPDGRVATLAYWQQAENVSRDEVPYFQKR